MTYPQSPIEGPLYRRLAQQLREQIESGVLPGDAPLPAERDLAQTFGVSRDTVRKALRLLESLGLVYGDQGRGTFIAPAAVQKMSRFLDSFSLDTKKRGDDAGQKIISIEKIPASMAVAGILEIDPMRTVTRVQRVRTINGKPVGIHDAYLSLPPDVTLTQADLEQSGSLYRLLSERFNITAAEALESLGAIAAGPEDVTHLKVEAGSPLLLCERITLSERRQPVEYCVMRYVSSYRYTTRINQFSQLTK